MFVETVKTEGLAHLSYMVGDGQCAAVIDPRRDVRVYERIAQRRGVTITHIFETHRNEDLVTGSQTLANRTGAEVLRGTTDEYDVPYAQMVREGRRVELGQASLTVVETPGHTLDSISLVLRHHETGESALGVFTGDALFVNDVGRTDFYPDRAEEVANLLYDSLHEKLLPLGDQTVVYPAHGAGSVCGQGMATRDFSTLGYEKAHNPRLQLSRGAFVKAKTDEHHDYPPYFRKMEELNASEGPGLPACPVLPGPIPVDAFARKQEEGMLVVDLRMAESFAGGHLPGSICLPADMIASFAGWVLAYDTPLGLVAASAEQAERAALDLARIGYDRIEGYLNGAVIGWAKTGRRVETFRAIDGPDFKAALDGQADFTVLDVRSKPEVEEARVEGSTHIFIGELTGRLDELDKTRRIVTFCGSGQRAAIAASLLQRAGFEDVSVNWGSMAACQALGCRLER
ncbi:MBL fold metallo-hydrolase [Marinicauda pacifica]|uniref:MBL fold metallo-hydrolase n=1 Tax=Marinicauda pacifica TaxID=1133559 RepID=UPI0035C7AE6F